jgi:hypothetical protein
MNKRIQELAEQHGFIHQFMSVSERNDALKKFEKVAELILKECANAIINDRRLNDVRSAANGCVRTIREHFGVE